MRIAITGATSMLGIATIKECIEKSIEVLAFCRPNSSKKMLLPKSELIKVIECDLDDMKNITLDEKVDCFIHFGWAYTDKQNRNDVSKQLLNVQYTLDAVALAKRLNCKKFIGAGSQAEYGTPNVVLKSSTPVNPVIAYGIAKYTAGKAALIECRNFGMDFNWVRILSVYGTNDLPTTLISQLVLNVRNNLPMGLSGCEQTWDYLFEDDAGRAFIAIAQNGKNEKIYNLGSGIGRKLHDFVQDVVDVINPGYEPRYGMFPYNENQPFFLVADVSELKKDTGWEIKVNFIDGIQRIMKIGKESINE